ncbi:MAG: protein kinase [Gemmatales bacterium]|nr:protein kinase [Gemmatales bacterium]MDW8387049.1 protein kinase [Gemmatales bacterium]
MPEATLASLVDALEDLQLLEPAQWQELAAMQPRPRDPRELLRTLLNRGWLTRFQAAKLLRGDHAALRHGAYVLLDQLGEGGMGQVYKARHQKLGRIVALKIIHKERIGDPKAVSRFHREMQAVGALQHPNIIQAYDAGEANSGYYLAMEFVEGTDFARLLRDLGRFPVHRACDYIRQAALGLQHAHERGLVHRDIKPSNLFLARSSAAEPAAEQPNATASPEVRPATTSGPTDTYQALGPLDPGPGIIKILDLGLARLERSASGESLSQVTCDNLVIGTPDYIAPEQAYRPHEVDARADIYSLGCTLYHLLTGKIPFPGGTLMEKLIKHRVEMPEPVLALRPEVPPELNDLVLRMMAKEPCERPASAAAVAEALAPFCSPDAVKDLRSAKEPSPESSANPIPPKRRAKSLPSGEPTPQTPRSEKTPSDTIPLGEACFAETPVAFRNQVRPSSSRDPAVWLMISVASTVLTGTLIGLLLFLVRGYSAGPSSSSGTNPAATKPESSSTEPPPNRAATPPGSSLEREWLTLVSRCARAEPHDLTIRRDLLAFASRNQGTPYASRAIRAYLDLPSVLDRYKATPLSKQGDSWSVILTLGNDRLPGLRRPVTRTVAFNGDARLLATGTNGKLCIWNIEDEPNEPTWTFGSGQENVGQLSFSPDGQYLLAAAVERDRIVRVYKLEGGQEVLTVGALPRTAATCGCFSPDGKRMLIGGDGMLSLWNVEDMSSVRLLKNEGMGLVQAVEFLPEGQQALSVGKDGVLRVWQVEQGNESKSFGKHDAEVTALAVHWEGRTAATTSLDQHLRFWNLSDGSLAGRFDLGQPLIDLSISPDGEVAAVLGLDGRLYLVETLTGKQLADHRPPTEIGIPSGIAFACDGRHLAVATRRGKVWIIRLGR